ncbi:MAG: hypothetical protein VW907_10360, partial [Opitutae bacterium]
MKSPRRSHYKTLLLHLNTSIDSSFGSTSMVESMVQTFIMTFLTIEEHKGKKTNFVSINNVKFKKMIVPG